MRVILVFAIALSLAPAALAKGPDTARVCGETCVTLVGPEKVNVLALWTSGFTSRVEPPAAPFFSVSMTSSLRPGDESWLFLYAPSAKALKIVRADFSGGIEGVRSHGDWVTPSADVLAAYNVAIEGIEPFPKNRDWTPSAPNETWAAGRTLAFVACGIAGVLLLLLSRRIMWRRLARRRLSI